MITLNLTDYDSSLKTKLLNVFPNVVNSSEDKALEHSEDDVANVSLPLISFWRLTNGIPDGDMPFSTFKRGRNMGQISDSTALVYREIYLTISYQIDIWSDRKVEVDAILTELLLYFREEPYFRVIEDNYPDGFDINFKVTDVVNTGTDLTSFTENGDLYRQTVTIEIDKAPLMYPREVKVAKSIPIRVVSIKEDDLYDI